VIGVEWPGGRWAGEKLAPHVSADVPVVMITKGLEWDGSRLVVLPDVLESCFPDAVRGRVAPAAVAGPCIAGELARRVETCVVVSGRDRAKLEKLCELLRAPYYHPFASDDLSQEARGAERFPP
jgi:glycerol-3-phosphate dehydrogenase (NAD(P)+)